MVVCEGMGDLVVYEAIALALRAERRRGRHEKRHKRAAVAGEKTSTRMCSEGGSVDMMQSVQACIVVGPWRLAAARRRALPTYSCDSDACRGWDQLDAVERNRRSSSSGNGGSGAEEQ